MTPKNFGLGRRCTRRRTFTFGSAIAVFDDMLQCILRLLLFTACCGVASAAALVSVPGPKGGLPTAGLEVNRGQAKPEILFVSRGIDSLALTAQSVLYSPLGVRLSFVASNLNPRVSFLDPLPGVVNSFTGTDTRKWVTGIPRYATARLAEVYPGVDVQYAMGADGQLTWKLSFQPGTDPKQVVFEVPEAAEITRGSDGSLRVRLGPAKYDPALYYEPPLAFEEAASGRVSRSVSFEVKSKTQFGFQVEGQASTLPLQIEMKLDWATNSSVTYERHTVDATGNMFVAATIPDAAGKDAPFPTERWAGCDTSVGWPLPCWDVVVYKFSKAGELVFASYLAGRTRETAGFVGFGRDGAVIVTGTTDSADFPVTAAVLQGAYGGPAAKTGAYSSPDSLGGDFFAARVDAATGAMLTATFLGGPNADQAGETALGVDGSVYFMPKWLGRTSAGMPVSPGALQATCAGDQCQNGYAAHLSPSLDRLLYGTYLPGTISAAKLHSDGTVYFAGDSGAGFPVTPNAYRRDPAGGIDGVVARLNTQGTALVFGTYIGGPDTDWILRMAVAPDGSVWAAVSSFVQCCVDIRYRLVRLDGKGERLLADKPISVSDLAVDRDGNLIAAAYGEFPVGPEAFLASSCGLSYLAYVKLNPSGELLFATYLPSAAHSDFQGTSARGLPVLRIGDEWFEVVEGQSMEVYAGCVVDAASFAEPDILSPGAIVTLFGRGMGPREGVAFQLVDERLPTSLGGTRVLLNGEAVPILYASYWQVNVILPYSLAVGARPKIQVESKGTAGDELVPAFVTRTGISIFRLDYSPRRPAAALNEDGTINSPGNPAQKGSRVVLFGTGGGATVPPSTAGEVTPLAPRPLEQSTEVEVRVGQVLATVEYAGAAPGLLAGVIQINVKLPDVIPQIEGFPPGVVPLWVGISTASYYPGYVTVAVRPD
jgi:uncharacterized protein (TIGR03437 family)